MKKYMYGQNIKKSNSLYNYFCIFNLISYVAFNLSSTSLFESARGFYKSLAAA